MKLLLVTQKQVSPGKASCALWAFERLFFGMGPLVTFQMFQSGK